MRILLIFIMAIISLGCASRCNYKSDLGVMNDAQANNPSFPVLIQGSQLNSICQDSQGIAGLCSYRLKRDGDLNIRIIERPYSYSLKMICSDSLGFPFNPISVLADTPYTVTIDKKYFANVQKNFSCEGEIYATDRDTASIKFRVNITLVDATFQSLEQPERVGDYLSFGEHALYTVCGDSSGIKTLKKETYFEDKDKKYKWCLVEAESGRTAFNGEL